MYRESSPLAEAVRGRSLFAGLSTIADTALPSLLLHLFDRRVHSDSSSSATMLTVIEWILTAALMVLLSRWWTYLRHREMLKNMPGIIPSILPWLNPVFTYLNLRRFRQGGDMSTAFFNYRHTLFTKYRDEGIFQIWCAHDGGPLVAVFRADLLEEVLKSPSFATKAIGYDLLEDWLGKGLLTSNGSQWKTQRRMLTPSFHFAILNEYVSVMNSHSLGAVKQMRESDGKLLKNVELSEWATDCTMAVLLETVMGLELGDPECANSREYINALIDTTHLFATRFVKPWNRWDFCYYHLPEGKRYLTAVASLHAFSERVIAKKIKDFTADPSLMTARRGEKQSFMDMLVSMHLQEGKISVQEMKEQVATFMFAGHDTTGWAMAWSLYQLGIFRDVQAKVHEEIDMVFRGDMTRHTTEDDLKELTYFDRVLKECQRLNGSVPSVSRKCTVDGATLGEYRIPKGATVAVALRYLHRDPDVFPQPEKFDPDRFLPENFRGCHPYSYIPFSAGARNCIGQRFAIQELKISLVNILRNFQIVSSKPLSEIKLAGELILRAKNGLHVDFIPR